jgi:hypothetical protein
VVGRPKQKSDETIETKNVPLFAKSFVFPRLLYAAIERAIGAHADMGP